MPKITRRKNGDGPSIAWQLRRTEGKLEERTFAVPEYHGRITREGESIVRVSVDLYERDLVALLDLLERHPLEDERIPWKLAKALSILRSKWFRDKFWAEWRILHP